MGKDSVKVELRDVQGGRRGEFSRRVRTALPNLGKTFVRGKLCAIFRPQVLLTKCYSVTDGRNRRGMYGAFQMKKT